MIGFKVFNSDLTCRGFQYEIGKSYEMDGEIKICERGFHFCKNIADCFNYYDWKDGRFAKIEAYGDVIDNQFKSVTNKIRILEEISKDEAIRMSNIGRDNSGILNSGNYNTGNSNTGNFNSGNYNTGNSNTGNFNTGHCNTGHFNTGRHNTGNHNTGDHNTGRFNTGHYNTGNFNTGHCNTGNFNTGDWNKSSFNVGCFMTINPFIMMFNKPSNWRLSDWLDSKARGIMLKCQYKGKNDKQKWWDNLSSREKNEVMSLPNFNPDVFYECTGIVVEEEGE